MAASPGTEPDTLLHPYSSGAPMPWEQRGELSPSAFPLPCDGGCGAIVHDDNDGAVLTDIARRYVFCLTDAARAQRANPTAVRSRIAEL